MSSDWLTDQDRRRIWWPSLAAAGLPFGRLWLAPSRWTPVYLVVAGVLTVAIALIALGAARDRLPSQTPVVIAFVYVVVAALRSAGGNSGVAPVALLPVFWLSLHGTRRQLWYLLIAVRLTLFLPLAVEKPASAPSGAWRAGILFVAVSGIVGMTLHALVTRVRDHERERELIFLHLATSTTRMR